MATNHIQEGKIMTWTNGTGAAIASGDVVVVGTLVCVALGDIASTAVGELAIGEVWEVAKETPLVIDQGDLVYWDDTNNRIDKTNTNVLAGRAFKGAVSAATTVQVLLNV